MMAEGYRDFLKEFQEIKNKLHRINKSTDKEITEKAKNIANELSSLSNYCISQISDCKKIQLLEKTIIISGETVKLKTNIDDCDLENAQIIFDGYVPMDGFLIVYTAYDENGKLSIYAKNNTPEDHHNEFCQYEFCDSDVRITRLSGNFEIKSGSTIGILMPKVKEYTKEYSKQ